jgi:hypothetical protein
MSDIKKLQAEIDRLRDAAANAVECLRDALSLIDDADNAAAVDIVDAAIDYLEEDSEENTTDEQ